MTGLSHERHTGFERDVQELEAELRALRPIPLRQATKAGVSRQVSGVLLVALLLGGAWLAVQAAGGPTGRALTVKHAIK